MLAESLVYALSLAATPSAFRPHLGEAVGLWARGRRCAGAWAPHVARTRGLIEAGIAAIAPRRTVAVLGSGPLFDVPLEALAGAFDTVLLVDRAHLATSRHRLRRAPNAARQWRDLAATGPGALDFLAATPGLDWVLSVNLLSQLGEGAAAGTERRVIDAHLADLAALPCKVTLITDIAYRRLRRDGSVAKQVDLLHGRPMPPADASWLWEVAPFGEEAAATRRVHTVAAWHDWGRAAGPG